MESRLVREILQLPYGNTTADQKRLNKAWTEIIDNSSMRTDEAIRGIYLSI